VYYLYYILFFIYYHSPIFQENLPLHDLLCWPEEINRVLYLLFYLNVGLVSDVCPGCHFSGGGSGGYMVYNCNLMETEKVGGKIENIDKLFQFFKFGMNMEFGICALC